MTLAKIKSIAKLVFLIITSNSFTNCTSHSSSDNNKSLAGMYKLYRIEEQDSSGKWNESDWAKGGEGYIIYDGLGHMAVQIIPNGYKDFKWLSEEQALNEKVVQQKADSMSLEELKATVSEFASNYVYVANYSIDDTSKLITHRRLTSTIPSIWNTEVKRKFSFNGDTLILRNPTANRILKWVRQK